MAHTDFETQVLQALGGITHRLDGIHTRLDGIDTRLDGLEANFEGLGKKVEGLEVSFEGLGKKVDGITENLAEFQIKQEDFNTAIWNLNTQAFSAISDIRSEVVAPWKIRQSR